MATALHHTYHLFVPPGATRLAAGIWREHLAALRRSGLAAALDSLHVNVVGERIDIDPPACRHTVAHVASGHEMVTLQTVERLARGLDLAEQLKRLGLEARLGHLPQRSRRGDRRQRLAVHRNAMRRI